MYAWAGMVPYNNESTGKKKDEKRSPEKREKVIQSYVQQ